MAWKWLKQNTTGKQVREQLVQPFISHGKLQIKGDIYGQTLKGE